MLSGETPHFDWTGKAIAGGGLDLAGGFCGVMCQIKGDWAFYKEALGFPQWNEAVRVCWLCRASSTNPLLRWTDCTANAAWKDTVWDHETDCEHVRSSGLFLPVLLDVIIGLRLECVMIDVLHTVDLGIAAHIVGSGFWLIVFM